MPAPRFLRRKRTYFIGVPVLIFLVVVVAPFVYIHFIEGPAPAKLTLKTPSTTKKQSDPPGSSGSESGNVSTSVDGAPSVDGMWKVVKQGTVVGYRVGEVLFGQNATAVGRTDAVTQVSSDQGNRDRQFQGRIMDTATYPTATFELTQPIALTSIPHDLVKITEKATGDLTLRGKTRSVTFDVVARRNGDKIEINGTIPITFADWGIPNPSFGPASTEDHGVLEFILVFGRAS
jgi:hypothetical protein